LIHRASHDALASLTRDIANLAARRHSTAMGGFGSLSCQIESLAGTAVTSEGSLFRRNCDAVLLCDFVCGEQRGLCLAVMTGNYKDEGTGVASSAAALALEAELREPLLGEADLAPAMRRAIARAHDDVFALSGAALGPRDLATVMGRRDSLRSIGCSLTAVAALPRRLFGVHIGEGRAFLLRDDRARKLTLEHTLGRTKAHRDALQRGEEGFPMADLVVTKVLGLTERAPEVDVFRTDLEPGDRVMVGSLALADEIARDAPRTTPWTSYRSTPDEGLEGQVRALGHAMTAWFPQAPATVGLLAVS
jgi:hypothetical protein